MGRLTEALWATTEDVGGAGTGGEMVRAFLAATTLVALTVALVMIWYLVCLAKTVSDAPQKKER